MKTTNKFKIALFAVAMLFAGAVNAQRTSTSANAGTDFTRQANTTLGSEGGSVKVVDNKGTIKYLQANNGVTLFTDTAPNGGIITTWQLGGTLTDNTYIDASGAEFGITGISEINATANPVTDIAATAYDTTGFTLVVRDEATGEFKKLLASEVFEVTAIRQEFTIVTNVLPSAPAGTQSIPVAGLPVIDLINQTKLFVFRNGVKLRFTTDFTGTTAGTIDINTSADLPLFVGDVIEVQYIN